MEEKEIEALIRLLDDPDTGVFEHIEETLFSLGHQVIEPLVVAGENSLDTVFQERAEQLIHKIQFQTLLKQIEIWKHSASFDLLRGLLIINHYAFPELEDQLVINQIESIKREVWMEMMYDMSPLEKVRLLNKVFFNSFQIIGNVTRYYDPQNSYISDVLKNKKGNPILLACIYSIVAQKLDIPIYGINLPQHFIVAYVDEQKESPNNILFYINPFNKGQTFNKSDVLIFLKRLKLEDDPKYLQPCTNIAILIRVLRNLISSYDKSGHPENADELSRMLNILLDESDIS